MNFPRFLLIISLAVIVYGQQKPPMTTDARIADIEKRLKFAPGNVEIQNELAGNYLQKMRETADGTYLDRAARIVDSILKTNPAHYEARRRRLEIDMQLHLFKQAAGTADLLRQQRPDDTVVLGLAGDAWMEMGDYDRAADLYQRMVDVRPNLASYNRVAFYRFVTGDPEGAIGMMRKAIAMGSPLPENTAWCLSEFGTMLFKTGAIDQAELAYEQALQLFPGYHRAQAGLGILFASRGRFEEAVQLLRGAQAVAPFPEYAGWLARIYEAQGNQNLKAKQVAMLDVADRLGTAAGEAANRNLSLAYADLEHNKPRALQLARAELDIRKDVYTYDALAWALFKNGLVEPATTAIEKALAQNTPEPAFHQHAAQIFESAGRKQQAEEQWKIAAALNPKFGVLGRAFSSSKLQ